MADEEKSTKPPKVNQHELISALAAAIPFDGSSEGSRLVVERWLEENKPAEASESDSDDSTKDEGRKQPQAGGKR
jgi:hypothetical protein